MVLEPAGARECGSSYQGKSRFGVVGVETVADASSLGQPNWCREQALQEGAVRILIEPTGLQLTTLLHRLIEALTDPKTWLFALLAAMNNIPNSLTNQRSIIVASFGFTTLQTTLLGCEFRADFVMETQADHCFSRRRRPC